MNDARHVCWFGLRIEGDRDFLDVVRWDRPGRPTKDDFRNADLRAVLLAPMFGGTLEIVQVSVTET